MVSNLIYSNSRNKKLIAQLIDPGKMDKNALAVSIKMAEKAKIDFFLVGGSITENPIDETIVTIKSNSNIPVVLFPGNLLQLSNKADAMLFLSLISGRNPDLLIGNHVIAAPFIKRTKMEVIPTGYILIENGKTTSVEYMSFTNPIPKDKPEIAIATACAGELLGLRTIYLEAGSGAAEPVSSEIISGIRKSVDIPIIVGGGLKSIEQIESVIKAGADIVVVGTAFEDNPEKILNFADFVHNY